MHHLSARYTPNYTGRKLRLTLALAEPGSPRFLSFLNSRGAMWAWASGKKSPRMWPFDPAVAWPGSVLHCACISLIATDTGSNQYSTWRIAIVRGAVQAPNLATGV